MAKVRPLDQEDIRLAGEALADELKLGGKLDVYVTATKMIRAADLISSRASPETWKHGKPKKEKTDASVSEQAPG
jgi:hypothetical protein